MQFAEKSVPSPASNLWLSTNFTNLNIMKKKQFNLMEGMAYTTPTLELLTVTVEQGFLGSREDDDYTTPGLVPDADEDIYGDY